MKSQPINNMPERTRQCATSECNDKQPSAGAFGVYINNSDECLHRLARPSKMRNPGLAVQLTENSVGIRDGSLEFPIKLPGLQSSNAQAMPAIIGVLPDGTLVAWKFGNFSGKKKLVLEEGNLTLVEDYGSDLLAATICAEPNCNQLEGLLGYKTVSNACPGEPTRVMTQICLAPKCCCDDLYNEDDCETCAELDELLP